MNSKIWLSAAVGVSALTFWILRPVPAEKKELTKDLVFKILQELVKKIKTCSVKIASFADTVKMNSKQITRNKLKEILFNDFSVEKLISKEKQEVYQIWETTEEEVNDFINNFCIDDPLVMKNFLLVTQILENAFEGYVLSENSSLPLNLSSQGLSEVLPEVFHCELHLIKTRILMNENNLEELEEWEIDAAISELGCECKRKIFEKFGFQVTQDDAQRVIRQGIENFSILDQKFKNFVKGLEDVYHEHLELIMTRREDPAFEEYLKKKFNNYMRYSN
jgi:hypothetical protein